MQNVIKQKQLKQLLIFLFISSTVYAHSSWARLDSGPLKLGVKSIIGITKGHSFPSGGHSLPKEKTKAFVITPFGEKTELNLKNSAVMLTADYTPVKNGVYLFYYISNTGIMSKTTRGWKEGGKDLYSDALLRKRIIQTGVTYAKTSGAQWNKTGGADLSFEIIPEVKKDKIILTVQMDSKPYAGIDINMQKVGIKEKSIGKTNNSGKIEYRFPSAPEKEILFTASFKSEGLKGDPKLTEIFSTSVYIDLR